MPRTTRKKGLLEHPLLVAISAAIVSALLAGCFAMYAAHLQAQPDIKSAKASLEAVGLSTLPSFKEKDSANSGNKHVLTIKYDGPHTIDLDSTFQDTPDYAIRFEICYPDDNSAICAFSIRAKKTITVTNLGNKSRAWRQDGGDVSICCLLENGSLDDWSIISDEKNESHEPVYRRTFSPPDTKTFLLMIPDYKKGSPLDAVVFSRGQMIQVSNFRSHSDGFVRTIRSRIMRFIKRH